MWWIEAGFETNQPYKILCTNIFILMCEIFILHESFSKATNSTQMAAMAGNTVEAHCYVGSMEDNETLQWT